MLALRTRGHGATHCPMYYASRVSNPASTSEILEPSGRCMAIDNPSVRKKPVLKLTMKSISDSSYILKFRWWWFFSLLQCIQIQLNLPGQATTILNQAVLTVLSSGSLYDQAIVYYLSAKCIMSKAYHMIDSEKKQGMLHFKVEVPVSSRLLL